MKMVVFVRKRSHCRLLSPRLYTKVKK